MSVRECACDFFVLFKKKKIFNQKTKLKEEKLKSIIKKIYKKNSENLVRKRKSEKLKKENPE